MPANRMETATEKIRIYPSSRKELKKRAGLKDTTIAAIVAQLLKPTKLQ